MDRQASARQMIQAIAAHPELELKKSLGEADIALFQRNLPGPLPPDIGELLSFTSGFKSEVVDVDFTGKDIPFAQEEFCAYGVPIARSILGNHWIIDINVIGEWGHVFYWCHDPPTVGIQFDSLASFIDQAVQGEAILESADALDTEKIRPCPLCQDR